MASKRRLTNGFDHFGQSAPVTRLVVAETAAVVGVERNDAVRGKSLGCDKGATSPFFGNPSPQVVTPRR